MPFGVSLRIWSKLIVYGLAVGSSTNRLRKQSLKSNLVKPLSTAILFEFFAIVLTNALGYGGLMGPSSSTPANIANPQLRFR